MKCPFCAESVTYVIDSRSNEVGNAIRRRRCCSVCKQRFTTYERFEQHILQVIKRNGMREDFNREKLRMSFLTALRKRPVSIMLIDQNLSYIESRLFSLKDKEVPSVLIGEWVMEYLLKLDKVAWLRFASVYRNFDHIDEFQYVLKECE